MSFFGNQLASAIISKSHIMNKQVSGNVMFGNGRFGNTMKPQPIQQEQQTEQSQPIKFTCFGVGRYGSLQTSYKMNFQFMGRTISSEMKCFMFAK